jgi:hypothetical protein
LIIIGTIQTKTRGVDFHLSDPFGFQIIRLRTFGSRSITTTQAGRLRHFDQHGYMYYYLMQSRQNSSDNNIDLAIAPYFSFESTGQIVQGIVGQTLGTTERNDHKPATELTHSIFFILAQSVRQRTEHGINVFQNSIPSCTTNSHGSIKLPEAKSDMRVF